MLNERWERLVLGRGRWKDVFNPEGHLHGCGARLLEDCQWLPCNYSLISPTGAAISNRTFLGTGPGDLTWSAGVEGSQVPPASRAEEKFTYGASKFCARCAPEGELLVAPCLLLRAPAPCPALSRPVLSVSQSAGGQYVSHTFLPCHLTPPR